MLAAALVVFHPGGAQAASGSTFTGVRGTVSRASSGASVPHGVQPNMNSFACLNVTDLPAPTNCNAGGDDGVAGTGAGAPNLKGHRPAPNSSFNGGVSGGNGKGAPNTPDNGRNGAGSLANFNGINDNDNVPLIGGHVTPPDQGLCVGSGSAFLGLFPAILPSSWR